MKAASGTDMMICLLQGLLIMSVDKNPRAVYEAVQAGLPVFVSTEAQARATISVV